MIIRIQLCGLILLQILQSAMSQFSNAMLPWRRNFQQRANWPGGQRHLWRSGGLSQFAARQPLREASLRQEIERLRRQLAQAQSTEIGTRNVIDSNKGLRDRLSGGFRPEQLLPQTPDIQPFPLDNANENNVVILEPPPGTTSGRNPSIRPGIGSGQNTNGVPDFLLPVPISGSSRPIDPRNVAVVPDSGLPIGPSIDPFGGPSVDSFDGPSIDSFGGPDLTGPSIDSFGGSEPGPPVDIGPSIDSFGRVDPSPAIGVGPSIDSFGGVKPNPTIGVGPSIDSFGGVKPGPAIDVGPSIDSFGGVKPGPAVDSYDGVKPDPSIGVIGGTKPIPSVDSYGDRKPPVVNKDPSNPTVIITGGSDPGVLPIDPIFPIDPVTDQFPGDPSIIPVDPALIGSGPAPIVPVDPSLIGSGPVPVIPDVIVRPTDRDMAREARRQRKFLRRKLRKEKRRRMKEAIRNKDLKEKPYVKVVVPTTPKPAPPPPPPKKKNPGNLLANIGLGVALLKMGSILFG